MIKQKAQDLEELFVNWLNELLSLSSTKELIFSDFKINKLDKNNLEAEAEGEDIKNYKVNMEVKAATYHQLKIEDKGDFWQAEVIFDV
jgi:SHS2 domain-containing protein